MVAQRDYVPQDERERSEVENVLANNPDIRTMVEMVAGHAASSFKWMSVELDTRQYDEWDPPLRMTIRTPYTGKENWTGQYIEFKSWVANQEGYDPDRLGVMVLSQKTQGSPE